MDLLTIYTHDSELQIIKAPPLISTIHKSPQHTLSLFQPAVSSPTFPWQRLLTVEILQLHGLKSSLHSHPYRTLHQLTTDLLITSRHEPRRNTPFPLLYSNCCIINNLLPSNGNVFTKPLPRNGRCLLSYRLATGLYAT
jgi:hypothetical protein